MSLVINHNMMAATASRNLNNAYNDLNKSVNRLSSGLRINSASDDAAGLAIREMMRSDVATLNQGVRNANDSISLLQTADGALGVIDEKLIRMKELAEQASTGSYTSTQRLIIDSEYQAMASEITRIANSTDFNGIKLLNGNLSGVAHDGSGETSTGALKIHFGTGNDSAEDYYYIRLQSATAAALGVGNSTNFGTTMDRVANAFATALQGEFGSMASGTAEEKKAFEAVQGAVNDIIAQSRGVADKVFDGSKSLDDQFAAYNAMFDRAVNHVGAGGATGGAAGDGVRVYGSVEELQQAAFEYYRAEVGDGLGNTGSFDTAAAHEKALNNIAKMYDNAIVLPDGAAPLKQMTKDEFKALSSTDRDAIKTTLAMGKLNTIVNGSTAQQSNTNAAVVGANYSNYDTMAGAQHGTAHSTQAYKETEVKDFISKLNYGYESSKELMKNVNQISDTAVGKYEQGTNGISEFAPGTLLKTPGILQGTTTLQSASTATAGANNSITAGSKLADGTTLTTGSTLGTGTKIGEGTTLGGSIDLAAADTTLGKGTTFGAGSKFTVAAAVGDGTTLTNGTVLTGVGNVFDSGTKFGDGSTITGKAAGLNIAAGSSLSLGGGSVVGTGSVLATGSTLGGGTTLTTTQVTAGLGAGSKYGEGTKLTVGSAAGTANLAISVGTTLGIGTEITGDGAFKLASGTKFTWKDHEYTVAADGDTIAATVAAGRVADPTLPAWTGTAAAMETVTLTTSNVNTAAVAAELKLGESIVMGKASSVGTAAQSLGVAANGTKLELKGNTILGADMTLAANLTVGNGTNIVGHANTLLKGTSTLMGAQVTGDITFAAGDSASLTNGTILRSSSAILGELGEGSTLGADLTTVAADRITLGAGSKFGVGSKLGENITLTGTTTMGGTTELAGATVLMADSKLAEGSELAVGSSVPAGAEPALNGAMFTGTNAAAELNGVYGKVGFNTETNEIVRDGAPKLGSFQSAVEDMLKTAGTKASVNINMDGNNIRTQTNAQKSLAALDKAIETKDNMRADIGALQNRLENTITNLQTQSENVQASESRISDVDVATEMTNFTRNQVLTQTAVSMLAQANSMSQMAQKLIG